MKIKAQNKNKNIHKKVGYTVTVILTCVMFALLVSAIGETLRQVLGNAQTDNDQNAIGAYLWSYFNFTATSNYTVYVVQINVTDNSGLAANTIVGIYETNSSRGISRLLENSTTHVGAYVLGANNFTMPANLSNIVQGHNYSLVFWASGDGSFIRVGETTAGGGSSTNSGWCNSQDNIYTINCASDVKSANIRLWGYDYNPPPRGIAVNLSSPANNSVVTSITVNLTANFTPTNVNISNITYFVWNSSGLVNSSAYGFLGTPTSSVKEIYNLNIGQNYLWNVQVCGVYDDGTGSECDFSLINRTFSIGVAILNNSFNPNTFPGSVELFNTTIQLPYAATISASLIWNNVSYPGTIISLGNNQYQLNRNLVIPNTLGTKNWFWSLSLSGVNINLTTFNQTVSAIGIDNCSVQSRKIFNFTLNDEDSMNKINGTIELSMTLYNSARTNVSAVFNQSYNMIDSSPNAYVCLNQTTLNNFTNISFSTDYQVQYYGNSSYTIEYKFAQNISISNSSSLQTVNLYDLLLSRGTAFTIRVTNPDLSVVDNVVIDIQRQYIPINQFISVESPVTDVTGATIGHLVAGEIYYNFIVTKNGRLLGTFNNNIVQCQNPVTSDCRINLNLINSVPSVTDFENYGNVSLAFTWSPSQRQLGLNFLSTDSGSHQVNWDVIKSDNWGNSTICSTSATGTVGTFTCDIPQSYGNSSIYANVFSDGKLITRQNFELGPTTTEVFGKTKIVLAILMYTTLALMLLYHPAMMVIGAMLGIISAVSFFVIDGGSFWGNTSIALWFVIGGFIILNYFKNRT